jgi:hypothetical protein
MVVAAPKAALWVWQPPQYLRDGRGFGRRLGLGKVDLDELLGRGRCGTAPGKDEQKRVQTDRSHQAEGRREWPSPASRCISFCVAFCPGRGGVDCDVDSEEERRDGAMI